MLTIYSCIFHLHHLASKNKFLASSEFTDHQFVRWREIQSEKKGLELEGNKAEKSHTSKNIKALFMCWYVGWMRIIFFYCSCFLWSNHGCRWTLLWLPQRQIKVGRFLEFIFHKMGPEPPWNEHCRFYTPKVFALYHYHSGVQ